MNPTTKLWMLLLLACLASPLSAQDFDLFYAKNVTDATHFSDPVLLDKELTWRKLDKNAIDGNQDEVNQIKEMLGSTQMKGLPELQQFWRMRDHSLLCFRINDGSGQSGVYHVEVNYGYDHNGDPLTLSLTTSNYFFTNVPLQEQETTVKVWRANDPDNFYQLRYWSYDWDNDNVYIFQLDQKRQSTGDTYKMEYVTTYSDANNEVHPESHVLELKETYFQSFYVPEGHTLSEVYLMAGNERDGDVKLKLNLKNLHAGIDIDNKFNIPRLLPTFEFAKHENRELMNFNWMGTGLFEKYDTLYLKLFNEKGAAMDKATINIHRIDKEGNKVDDTSLKYIGYDKRTKQHKILTHGQPAYIEILASGYIPTLYHYKGAADVFTRIVSEECCSAKLTLKKGRVGKNDMGISDMYLRYLNDDCEVKAVSGKDYAVCSIREMDLASKAAVDTVAYMENAGIDYPKMVDGIPIERFAQLEGVFSVPKGGTNPSCNLKVIEIDNGQEHDADEQEVKVVSTQEFTNFSRDYYFTRMSLVNVVPQNTPCQMILNVGGTDYQKIPCFVNVYANPDELKAQAMLVADKSTKTKDQSDKVNKSDEEGGLGISFDPSFKFDVGGFKIKTGLSIDILKQTMNLFINGSMNSSGDKDDGLNDLRENAKTVSNWNYSEFKSDNTANANKASASFVNTKISYEDWAMKESASLFDVSAAHIGLFFGGGFKMALRTPLTKPQNAQLQQASLFVEGGIGFAWSPDQSSGQMKQIKEGLEFLGLKPDFGIVGESVIRYEGGLKTFDNKMQSTMSAKNMGFFANLSISGRLAAWFKVRTPQTCLGGFQFGVRGGVKLAVEGGMATPLDFSEIGYGTRIMALGCAECTINVHALIFHYNKSFYGRVGKYWLYPDNDQNPFHPEFPFWLEREQTTKAVGNSFRALKAPDPSILGKALIENVAIDANPHFIDTDHVVYNDLGNPGDYNDDCINLFHIEENRTQTISAQGTAASQHMRSKRGKPEVVVFQQVAQSVNSDDVTDENAVEMNNEIVKHTQIRASIRKGEGDWQQMDVTPDDGFVDQTPVVTIQDDGKAACVYQHGTMVAVETDEERSEAMKYQLRGELQLRTFDGEKWSEPTRLFDIDDDHQPTQYDLFMRNDSVLVGVNMTNAAGDRSNFTYASKALASSTVSYVDDELEPMNFFMNRVGKNAVIAMLYERPDGTHDVYVKTLAMSGHSDGRSGCDLGLRQSTPLRVKIICDRSDDNTDDFAVLWTETSNVIRDASEGNTVMPQMGLVLNASRIHLSQTPTVTYPLTVGGENGDLFLTDFDGFLDDARIQVIYTLGDADSGSAVIMQNEKYFTNSFESDVTYTREALSGSGTLPVNVTIRNTGTSAIKSASVTINGTTIDINDSFVAPLQEKDFTVQYPIPEGFDGYMSSQVSVDYENLFKARYHARNRASMLRQSKAFQPTRVVYNDIDCNVVSRSIEDGGANRFVVELTDYSSRGLAPGTGLMIGIYPNVNTNQTLTGQAQGYVSNEDFHQEGGVRKAYAEVYVDGITEPVSGYIVPHIVDESVDEYGFYSYENRGACLKAPYVNLYPSDNPTKVKRPSLDKEPVGHRVTVKYETDGVRLGRLKKGDDVRLFNPQGICIHSASASASTLFIPLDTHGVYVLSAGGEVFKFKY